MKILIGGAGSTGSSLLRQILNRHPDIFSGPELNFFNKEQIFSDWQSAKKNILRPSRFFSTQGWVPYTGTRMLKEEYGWQKKELKALITKTSDLRTFVSDYFQKSLKKNNAKIWIEKTPSNSYVFTHFLDTFDDGKVIHIIRNPYDMVSSLVKRNFTPIFAAGMYIYNMAMALRAEDYPTYYRIKYEDLVNDPEREIEKLFEFLNLKFSKVVFQPQKAEKASRINTWSNQPNQKISSSSLNKFDMLDSELKEEIITALSVFKISPKFLKEKNIKYSDCTEVCQQMTYPFSRNVNLEYKKKIKKDILVDYIKRCYKFYSTGWFNYPAVYNWQE